jgi:predicted RNase H-like nuclease (RuvC/YqgF family)
MEPNYSKIFNKKTIQSVLSFCELNKIDDTDKFFKKCFQSGFNIEKYGLLGNSLNDEEIHLKTDGIEEKHTEIEVIVEKRVEVPVEKIVTKIEYISDKTTENELGGIITKLEEEMSKKDEELNKVRQSLDEHLSKPPIEIIKEVEVIKKVENNEKLKMMGETLQKLRKELSLKDKKIEELEGINKQLESIKVSQGAVYLKGSNITQKL